MLRPLPVCFRLSRYSILLPAFATVPLSPLTFSVSPSRTRMMCPSIMSTPIQRSATTVLNGKNSALKRLLVTALLRSCRLPSRFRIDSPLLLNLPWMTLLLPLPLPLLSKSAFLAKYMIRAGDTFRVPRAVYSITTKTVTYMSPTEAEQFALGVAYNGATAEIGGKTAYKWSNKLAAQNDARQRAFFDYSFNKQAEYSSPSAVRSRNLAAGINPYATSLSPAAGNPTGATASNGTPTIGSSGQPLPSGSLATAHSQSLLNEAEASSISSRNLGRDSYAQQFAAELEGLKLSNEGQSFTNDMLSVDSQFREIFNSQQVSIGEATVGNLTASTQQSLASAVKFYQEAASQPYLRARLTQEIENLVVQNALARATISATNAETRVRVREAALLWQETRNLKSFGKELELRGLIADAKRQWVPEIARGEAEQIGYAGRISKEEWLRLSNTNSIDFSDYGVAVNYAERTTRAIGNIFHLNVNAGFSKHKSLVESRRVGRRMRTSSYDDSRGFTSTQTSSEFYR